MILVIVMVIVIDEDACIIVIDKIRSNSILLNRLSVIEPMFGHDMIDIAMLISKLASLS